MVEHLVQGVPLVEAAERMKRATRRYVKQQIGWLRGEPGVRWARAPLMDEGGVYVSTPGRPSLLLSQNGTGALTRNLTEPAEAPQVRLRAAEKLLSLRQAANDQTLADIRLGPDGAVTI